MSGLASSERSTAELEQVIADAIVRRVAHLDPVNLAFGSRTDLLGLIDVLENVLGHGVERLHEPSRVGDVPHSQADGRTLQALFPDVVPVGLDDGVAATVDWMRTASAQT